MILSIKIVNLPIVKRGVLMRKSIILIQFRSFARMIYLGEFIVYLSHVRNHKGCIGFTIIDDHAVAHFTPSFICDM